MHVIALANFNMEILKVCKIDRKSHDWPSRVASK